MSLLTTRALTRHFAGLRAVHEVDFALEPGQIHALIGPNGAGKTTFVSLLTGRIPPTSGTVTFDGRDISDLPAHARIRLGIGYTFQITSIFANLTAYENVALAARRAQPARAGDATRAALAQVGLSRRAGQIAGDLAYGHQRLLEIAMGLAQAPKLLILDEPTQGLAEAEIAIFNALLKALSETTTILLIEHNMSVVMAVADTITVLDSGEVLATGAPDAIRANPAVQAAYLGSA